jgi:menaquinone-dependent protoporphyrinogen IX oxidase
MNVVEAFDESIKKFVDEQAHKLEQKHQVVAVVMAAFANVDKKPVSDLVVRLNAMQQRVEQLAKDVSVKFAYGKWVVTAAASSEGLLKELRYGSTWYKPVPNIDDLILAAVLFDAKRK